MHTNDILNHYSYTNPSQRDSEERCNSWSVQSGCWWSHLILGHNLLMFCFLGINHISLGRKLFSSREEALTNFHFQQRNLTQKQTSSWRLLGSNISQCTFCFSEGPGSSSVGDSGDYYDYYFSVIVSVFSSLWTHFGFDLQIRSGLGCAQWFGRLFWAIQIRICEYTSQNTPLQLWLGRVEEWLLLPFLQWFNFTGFGSISRPSQIKNTCHILLHVIQKIVSTLLIRDKQKLC